MAFRADNSGRVPFALVGVLILMMASGAGVYLGRKAVQSDTSTGTAEGLCEAVLAADIVASDLEARSMREALETYGGMRAGEFSGADAAFRTAVNGTLSLLYPTRVNGFLVDVRLNGTALYSTDAALGGGDPSIVPPLPVEISFVVDVNITVSGNGLSVVMPRTISSGTPFAHVFLEGLGSAVADLSGSLATDTFVYLVSLLCQKRTLEGWGSSDGLPATSDMVSQSELRRALDVSLRTVAVSINGIDPATRVRYSHYDPGDIFLSEINETSFDVSRIVAQALTGVIDQLVLKYYSYLGIGGLIDPMIEALTDLSSWLGDVWRSLTGDEGLDEQSDAVKGWIRQIFRNAGITDEDVMGPVEDPRLVISPPPATFSVRNATGAVIEVEFSGPANVTFPFSNPFVTDGWYGLYDVFDESFHGSRDGLESLLYSLVDALMVGERLEVPLVLNASDAVTPLSEMRSAVSEPFSSEDVVRDLILSSGEGYAVLSTSTLARVGDWIYQHREGLYYTDYMFDVALSSSSSECTDAITSDIAGMDPTAWSAVFAEVRDHIGTYCGNDITGYLTERLEALVANYTLRISQGCVVVDGVPRGWAMDMLVKVVREGTERVPSFTEAVSRQLGSFTSVFAAGMNLSGGEVAIDPMGSPGSLVLTDWSGTRLLDAGLQLDHTIRGAAPEIITPDRTDSSVHYSEPEDFSACPYMNGWGYDINATVHWTLSAWGVSETFEVILSGSGEFTTPSLRALGSVDYTPSSTLGGDVLEFALGGVADLLPSLESAYETAAAYWDILNIDVLPWLMEKGGKVIDILYDLQNDLIGTLAGLLESGVAHAVAALAGLLLDAVAGRTFEFSLFGLPILVTPFPSGLNETILLMETHWETRGTAADLTLVLRTIDNETLDLLISADVRGPGGWYVMSVDPLLSVNGRFLSLDGVVGALGFGISVPRVEQYKTFSHSLQEIPGVGEALSNIMIPPLGIKVDIDAGFFVDYSPPRAENVVINEVECNPPGEDRNNEWVEVYNPLPVSVVLDGWKVRATHGISQERTLHGELGPGDAMQIIFDGQTLDNENEVIVLENAGGIVMDRTPTLNDDDNDENTWQREFDGWGRWKFDAGSPGESHGDGNFTSDFLAVLSELMMDTLEEAGDALLTLENITVDSVLMILRTAVRTMWERVISVIEGMVRKAGLYLHLAIADVTGSAGAGYRITVSLDGQGCARLMRWLGESLMHLLGMLADPGDPSPFVPLPPSLLSHISLTMDSVFELELPMGISDKIPPEMGVPDELMARQSISFRLPLVGALIGKEWGPWSVETGLRVSDIPPQAVAAFLPVDEDLPMELWVLSAVFYPA